MPDQNMDLPAILAVFSRNRAAMFWTAGIILGLTCALLAALPERYSATALIMVEDASDWPLPGAERPATSTVLANARVDTEVELLRSDALALTIVDALGLTADPEFLPGPSLTEQFHLPLNRNGDSVSDPDLARTHAAQKLKDRTDVRRRGLTFVIAVSVQANDPRRAAELANAMASTHIGNQTRARIKWLEKIGLAVRDQARQAAAALASVQDGQRNGPTPTDPAAAEDRYLSLSGQLHNIEEQIALQMPRSSIVSPAIPPIHPSFPDRKIVLLAGMLGAMLAALATALLREQLVGGFATSDEFYGIGGLADTVALPVSDLSSTDRRSAADEVADTPLSVFSESIRTLRAATDQALRRMSKRGAHGAHVILVTSPCKGDGKTTTALALARSYALADQKTLLLDCDLRQPTLAAQIGLTPEAGFLEYLQDPATLQLPGAFCGRDPVTNLSLVMGAGASLGPTDGLLCSKTFQMLVDQARASFDVIIIDSPPLLAVVDGRILAMHADAVILAAKWASTGRTEAEEGLRILGNNITRALPVIGALTQTRGQRPFRSFRRVAGYSAAI